MVPQQDELALSNQVPTLYPTSIFYSVSAPVTCVWLQAVSGPPKILHSTPLKHVEALNGTIICAIRPSPSLPCLSFTFMPTASPPPPTPPTPKLWIPATYCQITLPLAVRPFIIVSIHFLSPFFTGSAAGPFFPDFFFPPKFQISRQQSALTGIFSSHLKQAGLCLFLSVPMYPSAAVLPYANTV